MTCKNARFETLLPCAIRHVGFGFNPVFQFQKICGGNATLAEAFNEMIQGSRRQRLPELWHCDFFLCRHRNVGPMELDRPVLRTCILVLSMKNHTLKLIGKAPDLSPVARRFDTFQQGQSRLVRSVGYGRRSLID